MVSYELARISGSPHLLTGASPREAELGTGQLLAARLNWGQVNCWPCQGYRYEAAPLLTCHF